MAKKETTSDLLKRELVCAGGGNEKDWKRVSKRKNEAGQIVREFENKARDLTVEVVQISDTSFKARVKAPAAAPKSLFSSIETDPAKNQAADRFIEALLSLETEYDELEEMAVPAGKALANRYYIAYCALDKVMGDGWVVTPVRSWDEEGVVFDHHSPLETVMPPNMGDVEEGTWATVDDPLSPLDRFRDFMQRGFLWNKDFQLFIDDQTDLTAAIEQGRAAEQAAGVKPPQP